MDIELSVSSEMPVYYFGGEYTKNSWIVETEASFYPNRGFVLPKQRLRFTQTEPLIRVNRAFKSVLFSYKMWNAERNTLKLL